MDKVTYLLKLSIHDRHKEKKKALKRHENKNLYSCELLKIDNMKKN